MVPGSTLVTKVLGLNLRLVVIGVCLKRVPALRKSGTFSMPSTPDFLTHRKLYSNSQKHLPVNVAENSNRFFRGRDTAYNAH